MRDRLTQKQETFCIKYFELGNASEAARLALYSPKSAAVIGRENLLKPQIIERINQLRQAVEDSTVANVLERKQRLTDFTREELYSAKGTLLRSGNITAIDTLNKMEKIYTDGATVNIDNRKVEIIVSGEAAKKLTEQIVKGENT